MFFVHLLLLLGFALPYAAKVLTLEATARLARSVRGALDADASPAPWAEVVRDWLARFDASHIDTLAFWVLLGGTRPYASIFVTTASAILLYNALRACLTLRVGVLRDQADRVQRTPALKVYYGRCHPLAGDDAGWRRMLQVWLGSVREWCAAGERNPATAPWRWRLVNWRMLDPLPISASTACTKLRVCSW